MTSLTWLRAWVSWLLSINFWRRQSSHYLFIFDEAFCDFFALSCVYMIVDTFLWAELKLLRLMLLMEVGAIGSIKPRFLSRGYNRIWSWTNCRLNFNRLSLCLTCRVVLSSRPPNYRLTQIACPILIFSIDWCHWWKLSANDLLSICRHHVISSTSNNTVTRSVWIIIFTLIASDDKHLVVGSYWCMAPSFLRLHSETGWIGWLVTAHLLHSLPELLHVLPNHCRLS